MVHEERRRLRDRREKPTSPLSRYSLLGRRKSTRRRGENINYYVDRYESRYFIIIVSILFLCILDGYFTFNILKHGGEEMNPFMANLLLKKPVLSLALKYLITAVSLVILIAHKNFQIFKSVKIVFIIYLIFFIYFLLILYEILTYFTLLNHG